MTEFEKIKVMVIDEMAFYLANNKHFQLENFGCSDCVMGHCSPKNANDCKIIYIKNLLNSETKE